ncbi:MAG: metallophosphoesterase family protein [Candidatus Bipolaricaulia bacterium]
MRKTLTVALLLALLTLGAFIYRLEFRPWWPPEGINWNYHQLQRIPQEAEEFSFAVLGDNKNSFSTFQAILRDLDGRRRQLAFAIDVGDLVFDREQEKYRVFCDQIKGMELPFLVALGNHDIREEGRAIYYELFGPFYYSFTVGDSYFIALDDANMVRLGPLQLAWLKQRLMDAQSYAHIFVFLHVPLLAPGERLPQLLEKRQVEGLLRLFKYHPSLADKGQVEELLALFREYRVTRVFASHIHGYFEGDWDGVPYTITGGAGAELMGTDPAHYFYHYVIVHVKGDQVTTAIVRFPSPPAELWCMRQDYISIPIWSPMA